MYSAWAIDPSQCTDIAWAVYRAKVENGQYGEYQQRQFSKQYYQTPEALLALLNGQLPSQTHPADNPFRKKEAQDTSPSEGDDRGLIDQMTNMHMDNYGYGYPNAPAYAYGGQSSNPFRQPTTSSQGSSQGYTHSQSNPYKSSSGSRRSQTPLPTSQRQSGSSQHSKHGQSSGSSGFQPPQQRRQSNTMQQGISIKRSSTAAPRGSGPQAPILPRNFTEVKMKDQRSFFKAGRVFKAYWKGESAFRGEFLRFLVVKPFKRYSTCLAIHSYQNQATTARSVRPRDHVLIHSTEDAPSLLKGEDEVVLKRDPIRVRLSTDGEPLKPTSRLNLSKMYTIEHYTPCAGIGRISTRDVERVRVYCAQVQGLAFSAGEALEDVDEEDDGPG